jgi:hypothetical protein
MSAANGEQESEESYACRYENLGREPWEGEEGEDDDADDDGYDAFENYFDQKPGHIHDMIDRIDDLKRLHGRRPPTSGSATIPLRN